jgi:hypothetical protein
MARARSIDRPLTYSSSWLGGNGHLMTEFFGPPGVRSNMFLKKGASQGLVDLIGGGRVQRRPSHQRRATLQRHTGAARQYGDARLSDYPICRRSRARLSELVATTGPISAPRGAPYRREDQSFDCGHSHARDPHGCAATGSSASR